MNRAFLLGSVAACCSLCFTVPLLAAQAPATGTISPPPTVSQPTPKDLSSSSKTLSATAPAETCLSDLRAFDSQMQKDGYWLGGSGFGFGYGYPMVGYPTPGLAGATGAGYQNVRPAYEIRTLVASANILARHGQQQPCEDVLATTRDMYKLYAANMRSGAVRNIDGPSWRQQQIAAAQPVDATNSSFRSDQLLGTEVLNPQNEDLGTVDDLVMSPQTGKIAYLVLARGGWIFGIGEKYVPVPWDDFKAAPGVNLLVLDAAKSAMDAAPQVKSDQFAITGKFDQQSQKVDAYWKTHLSSKAAAGSAG